MKYVSRPFIVIAFAAMLMPCGASCDRNDETLAILPPVTQADTSLIDRGLLDSLVIQIDAGTYGEVHSVLIQRRGVLVFERYFNGYHRDRRHVLFSVTKSVMSALIGIAVDRGDVGGVDTTALDFFSKYPSIENNNTWKQSIKLEHLLTMTAGFQWDELDVPYDHPDNDVSEMFVSRDWVKYVLDLPMAAPPGKRFAYNSGVSMLLSAILTVETRLSASDYADTYLFSRMGVSSWNWEPAPSNGGMSIGGWGLHMRPIDMVKFGRLYLQKGRWGDEQIVSKGWVEASTEHHAVIGERTEYGYQWWMYSDRVIKDENLDVNDIFIAVGRGNQYIWVVPQFDLVVVSTAWNDNNGKYTSPMFFRYIIPAVRAVEEG